MLMYRCTVLLLLQLLLLLLLLQPLLLVVVMYRCSIVVRLGLVRCQPLDDVVTTLAAAIGC
jgi:hypothetical protein